MSKIRKKINGAYYLEERQTVGEGEQRRVTATSLGPMHEPAFVRYANHIDAQKVLDLFIETAFEPDANEVKEWDITENRRWRQDRMLDDVDLIGIVYDFKRKKLRTVFRIRDGK